MHRRITNMRTSSRSWYRLLAGALLAAALAPGAVAQVSKVKDLRYPPLPEFKIPKPTRVVLDNGMVIILIENHELPLIEAQARIHTGARLEPTEKVGLAGLVGTVLRTGGTARMNGDALDDFLESKAAVIETSINTTAGNATMSCLKQDFADVLQVFADILRNPVFDEEKLKVARTQVTATIARQNDQPQGILFREYGELVYGSNTPYARTATYASVGSITRDDLVAWHQRDFAPNRVILGLTGDFKTDEALAVVRKAFGDWKKGTAPAKANIAYQPETKPGVYYVEKKDMTQSNIAMGHLGIKRDNPDYYAVTVMNEVLAGGFGARLFSNVRSRKGLAYTVQGAVNSEWDYPGLTTLWMTTKTETTAAGIDALLEEANAIRGSLPPTEEEVAKAKQSILNSFVFNSDSTAKILGQQVTYEYFGYPLDWLDRYRQGIEKVTTEQARAAASRYIQPDKFAILVVGPSEGRDRPLTDFGKVTAVDITIPEPQAAKVAGGDPKKGMALIEKAVQAMGGAARVDSVRTLEQKGTATVSAGGQSLDVKTSNFIAFPDRLRQDMVTPMGTMTNVLTPQSAFTVSPMGARPLPDSRRADLEKSLLRHPLALLQARRQPDFKALATGPGTAGGQAVELVSVERRGELVTLALDAATGQIVSMTYRGTGATGTPGEIVQTFSDWRTVDGISYPFGYSSTFEGQTQMTAKAETLAIDAPVNEADFATPEMVTANKEGAK